MTEEKKARKKMIRERIARKRGLRNCRSRNKEYIAWDHLTRNQKEVAKKVMEGQYHLLKQSGWGFLDRFFIFLKTIGFFATLDIDGQGFQRRLITIAKLILTYDMKILLGVLSMNQVPDILFSDVGLMMMIGYTAKQIKDGHCQRGKGKRPGPFHKNTLADALDRFSGEEVEKILNEGVKILVRLGFLKDDIHYILDATNIETTEKCKGRGMTVVKEKHVNKHNEIVEIEVKKYGFKLIVIRSVKSRIIVAAKVVRIEQHEKNYTLSLIEQAKKNLGKKAKIKVLLIDRGFIDGIDLWKIKHCHKIDFIIPLKTSMDITKDARGLRFVEENPRIWRAQRKDKKGRTLAVMGIEGLLSYDQYGDEAHNRKNSSSKDFKANPLNVVMVTKWKGEEYPVGKEKGFLTTLSVDDPLLILDDYDLRSLIENTTFRELKQGWLVGVIPKKTQAAVTSHIFLTLSMYNMTNAYRTELGDELTGKGIRRFRRETFKETMDKIVIVAGEYFGIFDLEEYSILLGKPPLELWNVDPEEVKKKYGIK